MRASLWRGVLGAARGAACQPDSLRCATLRCATLHRPQVASAQALKDKGNKAFKEGKLERAVRLYDKVGHARRALPHCRSTACGWRLPCRQELAAPGCAGTVPVCARYTDAAEPGHTLAQERASCIKTALGEGHLEEGSMTRPG